MSKQKNGQWRPAFPAAAITLLCYAGAAAAQPLETVRIGVEAAVPPFESRDAQGKLAGLNIELGNALCAQMAVRCVWVDQPYAGNIAALKANKFDLIMPMTPTAARRQEIDFSDAIYELSSRLVARKGAGLLPTANSLQGKRIGVLKGTSREAFALARWANAGVHVESFGLNAELIQQLQAGKIDASLQDTVEISTALLNQAAGSAFDFSGPAVSDPLLGSGIAMGLRKGDIQLKTRLNRALAALKENGAQQTILARYLPVATATSKPDSPLQYMESAGSLPFSEAVRVGNTLYLSGLLGNDENGALPKSMAAQTATIMNNLRGLLEKNGSSLEQVIQCKVILADIKDFNAMNRVYASYFPRGRFPARTTFAASGLVADAKVEIECLAYIA